MHGGFGGLSPTKTFDDPGPLFTSQTPDGSGPSVYVPVGAVTLQRMGATVEPKLAGKPTESSRAVTASERYALARHHEKAIAHAESMEEAASDGATLTLASEGVLLASRLSEMWRLRDARGSDWGAIVNFVQGVVAQVEFEAFAQDQCTAIRLILVNHLRPDADEDDVAATIMLLERAGFNPWRGISER